MSKIEGKLEMNELGHLLIEKNRIRAGSIIELRIEGKWVEVCIEEILGTYYPIPQIESLLGLMARMER